ncbi:MAG: hypothetical protein JWM35_2240 [Verrucomicrobia bacterium]|nr:hypothetical protein [Verrucomicrobiota bacterium]
MSEWGPAFDAATEPRDVSPLAHARGYVDKPVARGGKLFELVVEQFLASGFGMKRLAPLFLCALLAVFIAVPLFAAMSTPAKAPGDRSPGSAFATSISTVTGIAISPLLGTAVYGAYLNFSAKDEVSRAKLPWFAQWSFFMPALLIVGLCACKDSLGAALPPGFKKPLDVLETIENKLSGLVAAGAVIPITMNLLSKLVAGKTAAAGPVLATHGLAMLHLGAIDFSWLLDVLTIPFGIAVFAVVWMASHAINVLILLSPWGAIDAALKAMRTALLGVITLTATINPWVGALLSIVVIVIAYFIAGWAFRLTVFGSVFCWDFFTLRRHRFSPKENDNRLFAGANLAGVPPRTSGRLVLRSEGSLEFYYRPWLFLTERSAVVKAEKSKLTVGKGLFYSSIGADDIGTLFLLPPRYHGHEDVIARAYLLGGVRDAGLRRAWSVLKELFGGSAARTQVV